MQIKIPVSLAFCLFSLSVLAQQSYSIKGAVIDTDARSNLVNTSISILNAKDSILVKFALAADNGSFSINKLPPGKFILSVTYPGYADYTEIFTLDIEHATRDFGKLNMRPTTKILQEVIIKGEVRAIKIKGDTTEFNARAYTIQPNAKVEDLLKQLPGIQIDKDGKITANGQAVSKVLVDGEEFFGDDPTLVTKNLRADMVDKVQLFDKKSDQAAFTGIDDGKKTKTINIKLKEDKKNGAFGRITGGAGTGGYYEGQALYNRFKAKEKFSAYGTIANDGKTGLGFAEKNKLGTSGNNGNVTFGDDGGITVFFGNNGDDLDSFDGNYNGKGFPQARSGGLHYDSKWNDDKQSLNTNYKIGSIQLDGAITTLTQQSSKNATSITGNNQLFNDYSFRHKFDIAYQLKIDTSATLKVTTDGTVKTFKLSNTDHAQSTVNDTLVNRNSRSVTNNGTQKEFHVSALYTKKLKKPRRTISWSLSGGYDENQTQGQLFSGIDFYNQLSGAIDSTRQINQYKTSRITSSVFSSNITYSEPISKTLSVVFNYGLGKNNNHADKKSFNQSAPGVYNVLDDTYTNDYQFNQLTDQFGVILNYKNGNMSSNFGNKASAVSYNQTDGLTGAAFNRNFINWAPQATFRYNFSTQTSLSFSYNGNNIQPSIDQIQPVKVNTDPLNIVLGNPYLKPSFTNRFSANYNSYRLTSQTFLYINITYTNVANPIVNNTTTDFTTDKTTIQYINLVNNTLHDYNIYITGSKKIKPFDLITGINASAIGSISYSTINGALNRTSTATYNGSVYLQKYVEKKYYFNVAAGPAYTVNEFSLQPDNSNNAAGLSATISGQVYLPGKFQVAADGRYLYTAKTAAFDQNHRTILNASLNKTFLKDDNITLSLTVNNILNQDVNFDRIATANTITQTTSNSIKRFFMLSISWDFTHFATPAAKN